MKRIILVLACILYSAPLAAADPWAKDETTKLHNGELRIVCKDYKCDLSFNGKRVESYMGRFVAALELFEIDGADVVPMVYNNGGNRCENEYFFMTVAPDKSATVSKTFGLCGGEAKASRKGDSVEVKVRYDQKKPESFVWKKGVVTLKGKKI